MRILLIIPLIVMLTGCGGFGNVKTTITDPEGKVWTDDSKSDALVSIKKKDGTELVIDNRGRPGLLESALGLALTKTNVNLGLSNKPQEVD